jgi:hypothetical protein
MGYINDFRAKLSQLIDQGKREEALKLAADICLESYRNGMKAASVEEKDKQKAKRFAKRSK